MTPPQKPQRSSMAAPEDYFRGVSPLCRRILEDMTKIREGYGEKWSTLTYAEQCKILDQTIVDEATVRRYETGNKMEGPDCEYFPKLKLPTGQKIVSDEKLSARGYSCSWRDEHSAPFSWHTRSQMDLTLDTPPPTPPQSLSSPKDQEQCTESLKDKEKTSKYGTMLQLQHEKTFKASPFLWHYDPRTITPDPPDVVIGSTLSKNKLNRSTSLIAERTSFNHMVVRAEEERRRGLVNWIRGAFRALTGTCLPTHFCASDERSQLHPSSPFIHPELRPPHVIAKAAKVPISRMHKKARAPLPPQKSESDDRMTRDSTLKSECPSTETTLTYDSLIDKGSEDTKTSKTPGVNRSSLIYGTFEEEEINEETDLNSPKRKPGANSNETTAIIEKQSYKTEKSDMKDVVDRSLTSNFDLDDEDQPLISLASNHDENIPKTGFDFLDNW